MSKLSEKRDVKSNTVPLICIESSDDESDKVQHEHPNKNTKLLVADGISTINQTSNVTPPMQLSVKVEVEEFEEEDCDIIDVDAEIDTNEMLVNNKTNPLRAKSSSKSNQAMKLSVKKMIRKTTVDQPPIEIPISEEVILSDLQELSNTTKDPHDKTIEIHMRNSWGKVWHKVHVPSTIDALLQNALNNWKEWAVTSKWRDEPLMYKCYICTEAWWRYSTFRDHCQTHISGTQTLRVELETLYHTSYIIAYYNNKPEMADIEINSDCWICDKPFSYHKINVKFSYVIYECKYCTNTFFHCKSLLAHESNCGKKDNNENSYICCVCNLKYSNKTDLDKHLTNFHSVHSDWPIETSLQICRVCNQLVSCLKFHQCLRETRKCVCMFCNSRFSSRTILYSHLRESAKEYSCEICNITLDTKCMQLAHIVTHSDNYTMLYKCVICTNNVLLMDMPSVKTHLTVCHSKKFDKRRIFYERVVLSKRCLEKHHLEQLSLVTRSKSEISVKPNEDTSGKEETARKKENNKHVKTNFHSNKINNLNNPKTIQSSIVNELSVSNEFTPVRIKVEKTDDEVPRVKIDITYDMNDTNMSDTETLGYESLLNVKEPKTIQSYIVNQSSECNEFSPVKIKVENPDDDVAIDIIDITNDMDDTNMLDTETVGYESLLSSVFRASKNKNTAQILASSQAVPEIFTIKEESSDEEYFEDDIIQLPNHLLDSATNKHEYETRITVEENSNTQIKEEDDSDTQIREIKLFEKVKKIKEKNNKNHTTKSNITLLHESWSKDKIIAMNKKGNKMQYGCGLCNLIFNTLRMYLNHFHEHDIEYLMCPQCKKNFTKYSLLQLHVNAHVGDLFLMDKDESVSCSDSNFLSKCRKCEELVSLSNLFIHWDKHLELEVAPTVESTPEESRSKKKKDSKNKFAIKLEQRSFSEDCEDEANSTTNRFIKLLLTRGKGKNLLLRYCDICNHTFERNNNFKIHLIEHLLINAKSVYDVHGGLKCQFCGDIILKSIEFKKHLRDHAGLPVFECSICYKTFSDCSNYSKHKKVHNLALFECDLCKKKFHRKSTLKEHIMAHENFKPIMCKCCGRIFYSLSDHKRHIKTRYQRGFKCQICEYRFRTVKLKWDHQWEVHKIRKQLADCPICYKSFRKSSDVKNHITFMHVEYKQRHGMIIKKSGKYPCGVKVESS